MRRWRGRCCCAACWSGWGGCDAAAPRERRAARYNVDGDGVGLESGMRLDPGQIEVVDDVMAAVLRQKTGAERLAIADRLYSSVRRSLIYYLQTQHADWSTEQVVREAAHRLSHGAV
jgi:hypothetical protein